MIHSHSLVALAYHLGLVEWTLPAAAAVIVVMPATRNVSITSPSAAAEAVEEGGAGAVRAIIVISSN